jgi:ABC-2 type transport system permease protein
VNAITVLWSPLHLIRLWVLMALQLPVNALWALPTIGWLMLCSSFVRSKPFLWAIVLPIISGIAVSTVHMMQNLSLPTGWYWENVVGRLLLSLIPSGWMNENTIQALRHAGDNVPQTVAGLFSLQTILGELTSPDLLIGAVAGVAMIAGAVYFRRNRTEAYA